MMFQVGGLVKSASISERRTLLSQAFAGEVDPVGVVDHPVEDRIGECRDPDAFMMPPFLSVSCAAHER